MNAPDFKTTIAEIVSFGETAGFLIQDTTGAYDAIDNPFGWGTDGGTDPILAPEDIRYAFMLITPYESDEVKVMLNMDDASDPLYWRNLLTHLTGTGIELDKDIFGVIVDGHWTFKNFYYAGFYEMQLTDVVNYPPDNLIPGEIVEGSVSGATGYYMETIYNLTDFYARVCPIAGTFVDGDILTGKDSGVSVYVSGTVTLIGDYQDTNTYDYANEQSILTKTRNTVRKLPLDIKLPDVNNKHVDAVVVADMYLEALDDAVEVGQIENYEKMFDFLTNLIERIDKTYCINGND